MTVIWNRDRLQRAVAREARVPVGLSRLGALPDP